jgi:multiple sugar transport system substrate-binding protein
MQKFLALMISVLLLIGLTGCGEQTLLDPENPVTLTLWHVYGEQADAPMNGLVAEFNATVGQEKGIVVAVTNVTNTSKIGGQLKSAMDGEPGSPEMPDIFSAHTAHAGLLGEENLRDWNEWFSEKELKEYVPEFVDSGMTDAGLSIFPVSKSSYALFLNGSQFDRFSADTGVTYDDLAT